MGKKQKPLTPNEPLRHADHPRPVSRRDFLRYGFLSGTGMLMGSSIFSMFANPRQAHALSADVASLVSADCGVGILGANKIPFICFDLAGGANIAGSNVLVGQRDGQLDFLSTAGYNKMGLPGDMIPPLSDPDDVDGGDYINDEFGMAFHTKSAMLAGIKQSTISSETITNTNGAVIPARSDNDTGNNPHNPMYGILKAGGSGELLNLIGSRSSDSGGNSMAPATMIDPTQRPTKVDRPSDVTGLVDTGKLVGLLSESDAVSVLESVARISANKMDVANVDTLLANDAEINDRVKCAYVKSAELVERYGNPATLDPELDTDIVGSGGIFSIADFNGSNGGEYRKTASIMKMVVNGFAAAGTVTMGGYDYHTGDRATGELRDLRAGRCIGACLEYAKRKNTPLMIYVCSDGSVASNGMIDNSINGGGKGVWTGDNSSTAASFFLVYNPGRRPVLVGASLEEQLRHQQLGYFRADGSVETASSPAANNVNLLVDTVLLNYMALHGEQGNFPALFGNQFGTTATELDALTAFTPIVSGTILSPV